MRRWGKAVVKVLRSWMKSGGFDLVVQRCEKLSHMKTMNSLHRLTQRSEFRDLAHKTSASTRAMQTICTDTLKVYLPIYPQACIVSLSTHTTNEQAHMIEQYVALTSTTSAFWAKARKTLAAITYATYAANTSTHRHTDTHTHAHTHTHTLDTTSVAICS